MRNDIKSNFYSYLNYLLEHSTLDKPLWNKEVLIGLKKAGWTYIDGCMMVGLTTLYLQTKDEKIFEYIKNYISPLVPEDGRIKILYYNNYN